MSKEKFAFDKTNFILLGIGMAVVIIGFLLMTGPVSTPTTFEPDIFSVRRIKVAPVVCLLGFVCRGVNFQTRITQMTQIGILEIRVICVICV